MSYQIEHLKQNGLLIRTDEAITAADLADINEQIMMYAQGTRGMFNLILDMLTTTQHPIDDSAFLHGMQWASEANIGWVIYLTKNPDLSIKVDKAMNTHNQTYMVLDSLKSAMSIIALPAA